MYGSIIEVSCGEVSPFVIMARRRTALLIVDMTNEQVANLSYRKKGTLDAILRLVHEAKFDLVVDSHLWIGPDDASSLSDLYPDVGRRDTNGARLLPALHDALHRDPRPSKEGHGEVAFVPKYNYSSFARPSTLDELLRAREITEVYLTGINTDYCIFATALDAFYARYDVHVVEEGVSSVCGREGQRQGLAQMAKFGCADVMSLEAVLREYAR